MHLTRICDRLGPFNLPSQIITLVPLFPTVDSHDQFPDLRVPPPPAPRRLPPKIIPAGRQTSTISSFNGAAPYASGRISCPPRLPNPLRPRPAHQHKAFAALLPIIADEATNLSSDSVSNIGRAYSPGEPEEPETTLAQDMDVDPVGPVPAESPAASLEIAISAKNLTPPMLSMNSERGYGSPVNSLCAGTLSDIRCSSGEVRMPGVQASPLGSYAVR